MSFSDFKEMLEAEGAPQPEKPREKLSHVVILDDDVTIVTSLKMLLMERYNLSLCLTSMEAVAAVRPSTCACILDIKIKGHDGFWAAERIRQTNPELPIIFHSAYQDLKDPYEIINQFRPFAYIFKDSDPARLLSSLDLAVTTHRMVLRNRQFMKKIRAGADKSPGAAANPTDASQTRRLPRK